ncbi:MAG: PucR family transcriptional regulator ligand-binding domain-containing protein, partial [Anaerovoracaceae bacterium]
MRVTVADCLELDVFKDARVAAGASNLSNVVKSLSVLDVFEKDSIDFYDGNETEILLTGFLGFKNDAEKQCRFISCLAEKGCAAVVVYFGKGGMEDLAQEVIERAEKEMVPLIIMPESAGYSQTVTDVMDKVLYGDNFRNSLISNTVFHLLNFEKHSNFQSAVREAAINNDFQLII